MNPPNNRDRIVDYLAEHKVPVTYAWAASAMEQKFCNIFSIRTQSLVMLSLHPRQNIYIHTHDMNLKVFRNSGCLYLTM